MSYYDIKTICYQEKRNFLIGEIQAFSATLLIISTIISQDALQILLDPLEKLLKDAIVSFAGPPALE